MSSVCLWESNKPSDKKPAIVNIIMFLHSEPKLREFIQEKEMLVFSVYYFDYILNILLSVVSYPT